jgi:cytochrome b561
MISTLPATKMLPKPVIGLHWLSAFCVVSALVLAWLHDLFDDAIGATIIGLHRQLGLLVLILWALRLLVRWRHRSTFGGGGLSMPMRVAGGATHAAMYLMLLAMPVPGWAMTNASGYPVLLLNLWSLPTLVATDPGLADTLQDWHELGASMLIGLVALHVLAALYHHFVRRDDVLTAMLPLAAGRGRSER